MWPSVKCHLILLIGGDSIVFNHFLQCQNDAKLQKFNFKKEIAEGRGFSVGFGGFGGCFLSPFRFMAFGQYNGLD